MKKEDKMGSDSWNEPLTPIGTPRQFLRKDGNGRVVTIDTARDERSTQLRRYIE